MTGQDDIVHVVMVVPGGVDRGGQERVIPALLWLIEGLAQRHRVTVVALGQEPVACRYELLGATVLNVAPERPGPYRLARLLARAVRAAGQNGRPDVVQGMWASVSGLAAVLAARRYRVPGLVHVAGGELVAMTDIGYGGSLGRGGRWIAASTLRQADVVSVASQWMAEHVTSHGYRVDAVIPLGVDTQRFHPAPDDTDGGGCVGGGEHRRVHRLIAVADLNRIKDHATLLDALDALVRRHPELGRVELDVVGTDTLDGAVQLRAAELGLTVRAHGFVTSARLAPLLRGATLHVMSARHDAGPVAFLEAAACGLATVGTTVGHLADLAAADPPGAVAVPPRQADQLGEAIYGLLVDPARRQAIAEVARRFALAHDRHATVDAFEAAYQRSRAQESTHR